MLGSTTVDIPCEGCGATHEATIALAKVTMPDPTVNCDVARCDELLERGAARGVLPSRSATDLAVDLVQEINGEANP